MCKNRCLAIKSCRVTGCVGYDGTIKNRGLTTASICDTAVPEFSKKLDSLPVSATCKNYLHKDKRKVECYNVIRFGEILGARFWTISGSTQTAANISSSGYSFCRSKSINIEALVNECVDVVAFTLTGPNGYRTGRIENGAPHSVFGHDGTKFYGNVLPHVGRYSLTIQPDNFVEKQKRFNFTANNC
jgi:hypothetical protein